MKHTKKTTNSGTFKCWHSPPTSTYNICFCMKKKNRPVNLWLFELRVLHLHSWKVCNLLHFWSNMATKAKDLLSRLLQRSRATVCRIAPSLWKAELSFLICRHCEQRQDYLICSLSYPSARTNRSCSAHLWESKTISHSSLWCPLVPFSLPQLHQLRIPEPAEQLFNKYKSSILSFCRRKSNIFPFPLLHLRLYPNLRHYKDKGCCPVCFLMH